MNKQRGSLELDRIGFYMRELIEKGILYYFPLDGLYHVDANYIIIFNKLKVNGIQLFDEEWHMAAGKGVSLHKFVNEDINKILLLTKEEYLASLTNQMNRLQIHIEEAIRQHGHPRLPDN